ncbi:hypothetical protein ACFQ0K_15045 [Nocardioides caeni]|uniref:Protein kinase domain-containing protein n=1 Tax=Nocardioides caeni TaxID=574700 RepID=A0A4S8NDP6_9ACTN|nr:hypothetical protein [Nocardioides caeni]THV14677.1 hypothetical protein E9934_08455 [Nocardioides caeni]
MTDGHRAVRRRDRPAPRSLPLRRAPAQQLPQGRHRRGLRGRAPARGRRPPGTRVGLKLLSGVDEQLFRKILERSERLRTARHPHLAVHVDSFVGPPLSAHGVAEEDADLFYSAHVWVDGTSMRDQEPAPPEVVLAWLGQVASALDHLHTLPDGGFARRDVRAGNVIVRPDGTAVLMGPGR